jgi:hypothetical protein
MLIRPWPRDVGPGVSSTCPLGQFGADDVRTMISTGMISQADQRA